MRSVRQVSVPQHDALLPNARHAAQRVRPAGGSGITPMQQLIEEVLNNPEDKTQISLVYANTAEKDILLRERFDELAKKHDNFHVHYTLDSPPRGWQGARLGAQAAARVARRGTAARACTRSVPGQLHTMALASLVVLCASRHTCTVCCSEQSPHTQGVRRSCC